MMSSQIHAVSAAPARGQLIQQPRSKKNNSNGRRTGCAPTYLSSRCVGCAYSRRGRHCLLSRASRNPLDPLESILGMPEPLQALRGSPLSDNGTSLLARGRSGSIGQSAAADHEKRTGHFAKFSSASRLRTVLQCCRRAASGRPRLEQGSR